MTSAREGEARIHIDAPPDVVWALIADIERMASWSPECYRIRWIDGATSPAKPGARFKGSNKSGLLRWSMTCEVKVADPGREIAWSTVNGDEEIVRWTYRLGHANGGTDLVESFQAKSWPPVVKLFEDIVMRNRDEKRATAMRTTLERIKAAAEAM